MMSRRQIVLMGAAAPLVAASLPGVAAFGADAVKMFDTDNDGTLDLAEVKKAASNLFAKLDRAILAHLGTPPAAPHTPFGTPRRSGS